VSPGSAVRVFGSQMLIPGPGSLASTTQVVCAPAGAADQAAIPTRGHQDRSDRRASDHPTISITPIIETSLCSAVWQWKA
jgi:hypothetical protein